MDSQVDSNICSCISLTHTIMNKNKYLISSFAESILYDLIYSKDNIVSQNLKDL